MVCQEVTGAQLGLIPIPPLILVSKSLPSTGPWLKQRFLFRLSVSAHSDGLFSYTVNKVNSMCSLSFLLLSVVLFFQNTFACKGNPTTGQPDHTVLIQSLNRQTTDWLTCALHLWVFHDSRLTAIDARLLQNVPLRLCNSMCEDSKVNHNTNVHVFSVTCSCHSFKAYPGTARSNPKSLQLYRHHSKDRTIYLSCCDATSWWFKFKFMLWFLNSSPLAK